jgi:hypothetical protein
MTNMNNIVRVLETSAELREPGLHFASPDFLDRTLSIQDD